MVPIQEWSWGASLLIKIGFLGIGVLFVLWVSWPPPSNTPVAGSSEENLLVVSSTTVPPPVAQVRGAPVAGPPVFGGNAVRGKNHQQDHATSSVVSLVDINVGTRRDLEGLPGIGPVLAERIMTYREAHGTFQHMEDLVRVRGIGPKRLQQLRSFVKLGM